MFLAPVLYAIHAVLTGVAMVTMDLLGVKLGFGFSAGLFDYVINFSKATRPWLLLPVGAVYFALYYGLFRLAIRVFDLKTMGREDEAAAASSTITERSRGTAFAGALGGADNLVSVDACTTRLRLVLRDGTKIVEGQLKALGSRGIVRPSPNALQVVLGPQADQIADEIRAAIRSGAGHHGDDAPGTAAPEDLLAALGGRGNVRAVAANPSRLRFTLAGADAVDEARLRDLGARGVAKLAPESLHLIIGPQAPAVAEKMRMLLAES
jgi:PTS system N-acetylglucosamine-specific IIC component